MFPSTKPSLLKETKGSYSKFVIGILLITVASIFIASAVTAEADIHTDKNAGIGYLVHNSWGDVSELSRFDDVSLAKEDELVIRKDTEVGTIDIDWLYCGDLPLCITQAELDLWGNCIVAKIKGGYEPIGGVIDLSQGNDVWDWKFVDLPDLEIVWDEDPYMHEECYYDYYYGHVVMPADVSVIELASNQWPVGARPVVDAGLTHIPGKQVNFEFDIKYQGCTEEDQQFWLIMTHKNHFSNFRTPDL